MSGPAVAVAMSDVWQSGMTEATTGGMMGVLRRAIHQPHYPLEVMVVCAHWYADYPLSFRHLQTMMQVRGVFVDHSTVRRWAQKILPIMAMPIRRRKHPVGRNWRMDETCVEVAGQWKCLYRAVDRVGDTADFLRTATRDLTAARRYLERAIDLHEQPQPEPSTDAALKVIRTELAELVFPCDAPRPTLRVVHRPTPAVCEQT